MNRPLIEPIEALLDGDLHLIEADEALRRLHMRAGGSADGAIALPGLADIARMAGRFGTRIARSVRIADDEHDIALWVEATPEEDGVRLCITSWRSRAVERPRGALSMAKAAKAAEARGGPPRFQLQLDSSMRVIASDSLPERLGDPVGMALTRYLRLAETPPPGQPGFIESIAERQGFSRFPVTLRDAGDAFALSGRPLFDNGGLFAGYLCELEPVGPAHGAPPVPAPRRLSDRALDPQFTAALRQPVGRILANAETIAGRLKGSLRANYANYAGDIVDAAQHLRALIDDMSDLEAIERPGFAPQPDPIDLADLGRRAAGLLAVKASDHQMRIEAPAPDHGVPATGEFRRVLQILVNLVTNAIRYSPDGSTIRIEAERAGERAQIRVIDQGSGIAEADRERIFEKFERLGRSSDGGSGLGLYISRRIARALGGSLGVEASGADGTTFLLDLPARD